MRFNRPGFAYLWLVVVFGTVTAIVAASALPSLDTTADMAKARTTATLLRSVAAAVDSFNTYALDHKKHFTPGVLSELTTQITATDSTGCLQLPLFSGAEPGAWTTNGPFGANYFPSDDLWTPLGPINDTPSESAYVAGVRRVNNSGLPYFIQISNVDVKMARMLDLLIDGSDNPSGDTLFYTTPAADSTVLVSYEVYGLAGSSC